MGNVPATYRPPSRYELNRVLAKFIITDHLNFQPNYFMTVRIYEASDRRSASWINTNEKPAQLKAARALIKKLDRFIYGNSLRRRSMLERFPYLLRLETISKNGSEVPGHIHLMLRLCDSEISFFQKRQSQFVENFRKYLAKNSLALNLDFRPHDGEKLHYMTKYIEQDNINIFTRLFPVPV